MASRTSASELFNPSKFRWRLRQGHGYRATPLHTNQSRLRHRTGVPPYSRQRPWATRALGPRQKPV